MGEIRVASLLPAWTEWVAAFGAADRLVARSHACDFPPEVAHLPTVTSIAKQTDDRAAHERISPFSVDFDLLADLKPDVILTQSQCGVCAVTEAELREAVSRRLRGDTLIVSMEAVTFKQVLNEALRLGRTIRRSAAAMDAVGGLEARLHGLRLRLGLTRDSRVGDRPSVAAIEWLNPPMTAGHWTPDLIEMAGGRTVCSASGAASEVQEWDALLKADPDFVLIMPCSLGLQDAVESIGFLTAKKGWSDLRAVRNGHVVIFDGNAYFNRPGPRLYRSVELVAAALHGSRAGIEIRAGEMMRLGS